MPRFDGSGPMGKGLKTGRGMGYCDTNSVNTNKSFGFGMGLGRGFGRGFTGGGGRGFCRWAFPGSNNGFDEKAYLERQKEIIEERLNYLNNQNEE